MTEARRPAGTVRIGMKRRAGRKVRNHLYDQIGPEPADSDPSIGWSRDPDIVLAVVRAINDGEAIPGAQWWCAGGPDAALVYDHQTDDIAGGWAMAVRSRDDADRIVAAVNGA